MRVQRAASVMCGLILCAGVAQAVDYTWQGGDGLFSDSAKWSPATGTPANGDRAKLSTAADGTITWDASVSNNELQIVQTSGNTLVLDLGGNTYTLTNRFYFDNTKASSYVVVSNGYFTAPTNICEMKINAGVAPARLTFATGAVASLDRFTSWRSDVLVNPGASVIFNNQCMIGDGVANAVSTLNVLGGDVVCNHNLWIPNSGQVNSTSILNIASGSLIAKKYFSFGDKNGATSVGILNLSGGYLETWYQVWLGNSGGAKGIANVTGGRWVSKDQIEVAHREYTTGEFNMSGGEIEITAAKNFIIANGGQAPACTTGTVTMTGGSITLTNAGSYFNIGAASNALGRCYVGGDAFINTRYFKVGAGTPAVGECVVTGGLIRSIDSLVIGDVNKSYGWMRMEGGTVTNLATTYIGNNLGSTGVLEMAGGTWSTSNTLALGNNAGAIGSVIQTGGDLSAMAFNIGASGAGSYALSNGTLRTSGDVTVGVNGTGTVMIAGGSANVGVMSAGKNLKASGKLVMTDGTLVARTNLRIGDWGGVGTFDLSGGSVVAGTGGNTSIGNGQGSTGRVSVTGGRLQCNMSIYAGNNGTNTLGVLEVGGGAVVISNQLVLGNGIFTYGETTVSGGLLWIGDDIRLGVSSNTYGKLTVTGGSVTNRDFIDLGMLGTGILHVAGGELVTHVLRTTPAGTTNAPSVEISVSGGRLVVTNTFYFADAFGSQARMTLSGGTFSLPKLSRSRGYTTVVCDGGALEARRNENSFIDTNLQDLTLTANGLFVDSAGFTIATSRDLPDAAGEHGKLGKRGLGKFTLNTSATFSGPAVVEAGELALGAAGLVTLAGGCEIDGGALLNLSARALDFTLPAGTVSRVDGELRLASGRTLTVASGATLGGTGTVGRVVLQSGATLARNAASGGALLNAGELVIPAGATLALTGYTVEQLRQGVRIASGGSLSVAPSDSVVVTLDGAAQAPVALRVSGGVLTAVSFDRGTLIRVQ